MAEGGGLFLEQTCSQQVLIMPDVKVTIQLGELRSLTLTEVDAFFSNTV